MMENESFFVDGPTPREHVVSAPADEASTCHDLAACHVALLERLHPGYQPLLHGGLLSPRMLAAEAARARQLRQMKKQERAAAGAAGRRAARRCPRTLAMFNAEPSVPTAAAPHTQQQPAAGSAAASVQEKHAAGDATADSCAGAAAMVDQPLASLPQVRSPGAGAHQASSMMVLLEGSVCLSMLAWSPLGTGTGTSVVGMSIARAEPLPHCAG